MSTFTRTALVGAAFLVCSAGIAAAYPATVTTSLNLRSGPGGGYGVLTTMPPGAQVDIRNCLGNGWCELGFAGVVGYASGNYLAGAQAAPGPSVIIVDEPDTIFPEYYTYWADYPPYWDNGFFYFYNGRSYVRTRRDRNWWQGHRRSFSHYDIRQGIPPRVNRGPAFNRGNAPARTQPNFRNRVPPGGNAPMRPQIRPQTERPNQMQMQRQRPQAAPQQMRQRPERMQRSAPQRVERPPQRTQRAAPQRGQRPAGNRGPQQRRDENR